ncbi:MAG TPA: PIN domain-containing protein [Bryobacteraceae bacterium]|jgi:ribonuclease VapC
MNIINLGEVFYLSVKARELAYGERVLQNLRPRISAVPASDELVMQAAALKARHAISYADAFAAATAMARNAPLVTGDPELRVMSHGRTRKNANAGVDRRMNNDATPPIPTLLPAAKMPV